MTRRQEQLSNQIMELLSTVLQTEMQDPRLQFLTVTRVQLNRDASHALVYFISSDDEHNRPSIEAALGRAKGFFRSVLAETLDLRFTPDLTFRYDEAYEGTQRVWSLLDQLAEEERNRPAPEGEEASGDDTGESVKREA